MPSSWGSHLRCEVCGLSYKALRTGDTFASIKAEMYSGSDDSADWRYRRRQGVLGFWHKKKLMLWNYHVDQCADAAQDSPNDADSDHDHHRHHRYGVPANTLSVL